MSEQNEPSQKFWADERAEQDPVQAKMRKNMQTRMQKNTARRNELWQGLEPQRDHLLNTQRAEEETWREWNQAYDEIQTQGAKPGGDSLLQGAKDRYIVAVNAFRQAANHWVHDPKRQEFDELAEQYEAMKEMFKVRGFCKAKASPEK